MLYLPLVSIVSLERVPDHNPLQRSLGFGMLSPLVVTDMEHLRPLAVETVVHTAQSSAM